MNIQTRLIPITWLGLMKHGYGCGYIGLPPEHPWYEKHYDNIDADVHGGLTFSDHHVGCEITPNIWWVGFDTVHYNDNQFNCDKAFCEKEIESLKQQALEVAHSNT